MKKRVRLTENELKGILHNSIARVLQQKAIVNEHLTMTVKYVWHRRHYANSR